MKKNKVIIGIAAFGALLWLGMRLFGPPSVAVGHPVVGPAVQAVYATGTVEATVMMPIAPRIGARLRELAVDEGAVVAKDQLLARLEDEDVQNALQQLQAQEALAKKNYERAASLLKTGFVTKSAYDRAEADWNAAKSATAKAVAETGYMTLSAPADGLIIKRDGEVGQLISAGQPLFWLSCCAPLRISAEVDEEDISLVAPGQEVLIRADAFPGQVFHGKVQAITPKGDPVARSYRVRIEFTETSPLLIGMTAETNIIARKTDNALLLPPAAVVQGKVWAVKDGVLAQLPVQVGAKGAQEVEIISGVTAEDDIVLAPQDSLEEGARRRTSLVQWKAP